MEPNQSYISDEDKEIIRLQQEIIYCDNFIFKLENEPHLQFLWIEKKARLEYELQDLQSKDLI